MMKRILLVIVMAATMVMVHAEGGKWAVGGQVVYGSKAETAGVGPHVKYCLTDAFRANLSGNYYFKHSGVNAFDVNLEANYLFGIGEKVRLYPLAGVCLGIWHADGVNISYGGMNLGVDGQTESKVGANVGGGFEYLLGDHLSLNAEVKYQIISHASQVVFGIGASYRF
ncbi:MAG: porin family protein [Muribaculaceae bacterium]|jgi:outer membrane protein X|nr:porin family protein [Muribaculaceae bacterium]MBR6946338.1 porin family protein [Muribaculaceae bacterium]